MKCKIVYDSPGRLRVRCGQDVFSKLQETSIEKVLCGFEGVISAKASYANGGILVTYSGSIKDDLLRKINGINAKELDSTPFTPIQETDAEFKRDLIKILVKRAVMKTFLNPEEEK